MRSMPFGQSDTVTNDGEDILDLVLGATEDSVATISEIDVIRSRREEPVLRQVSREGANQWGGKIQSLQKTIRGLAPRDGILGR